MRILPIILAASLLTTPAVATTYFIYDQDGHGTSKCTIDQAVEVKIPGFDYSNGDVTLMCITPPPSFAERAAAIFARYSAPGQSHTSPPDPEEEKPEEPKPGTPSVPATPVGPGNLASGVYEVDLTGSPWEGFPAGNYENMYVGAGSAGGYTWEGGYVDARVFPDGRALVRPR